MRAPPGPHAVDAAWIENVLRRDGGLPDARVRGLTSERIGEAYGWDATIARVTLDADGAPRTLVVKWCTAKSASTELRFCRDVAPLLGVATARVLAACEDGSPDRAVLVLEDVAPARQGDSLVPVSQADGESLVDALAALHARFWGRTGDPAIAWLPRWHANAADRTRRTVAAVEQFLALWGERLPPDARDAVRALRERLPAAYEALARAPVTVIHADLHIENVLFRADGAPIVLDWTDTAHGAAAVDFARFLMNGPPAPGRLAHLVSFAPRYLAALAAQGVADYGAEALRRDVAHAAVVYLGAEVRETVRTDIVRPTHPHAVLAIDHQIRNAAENAAQAWEEFPRGVSRA